MGPALALSMVTTVSERVMTEKGVGKVSDSSAPAQWSCDGHTSCCFLPRTRGLLGPHSQISCTTQPGLLCHIARSPAPPSLGSFTTWPGLLPTCPGLQCMPPTPRECQSSVSNCLSVKWEPCGHLNPYSFLHTMWHLEIPDSKVFLRPGPLGVPPSL